MVRSRRQPHCSSLGVALALLVALAACGPTDEVPPKPDASSAEDTDATQKDANTTDAAEDVAVIPKPEDFQAKLVVDVTEGNAPLIVHFEGQVSGIDIEDAEFLWDFGNGSFSQKQSPGEFVYHSAGNYLVKLTVVYAGTPYKATDEMVIQVRGAADLKVTKPLVKSSTDLPPGGELVISYKMSNEGDAIAAGFDLVTVLSKDEKLDLQKDIVLESVRFEGMASGELEPSVVDRKDYALSLPGDLKQGIYFLLVKADANDEITELNEINNTALSTSFVNVKKGAGDRPDLVVSALSYPPGPFVQGQYLNYKVAVDNVGKKEATNFKFRVYASADETIDEGDLQVTDDGNSTIFSIAPGGSISVQRGWPIPASLPDGEYVLIGEADPLGSVDESDEDNNATVGEGTFAVEYKEPKGFDLDITAAAVTPHATYWNGSVKVDLEITNTGNADTEPFSFAIYISADKSLNPNYDTLLSKEPFAVHEGVPAGGKVAFSEVVKVPNTIPAGTYYVSAIVDPQDTLSELEESNNWAVIDDPVELYPEASVDVGVASVDVHPLVVSAGEEVKVTYALSNTGSTGSGAFTNWLVLSEDAVTSANDAKSKKDVIVAKVDIGNVDPGDTVSRTDKITIPVALDHTLNAYYLGVIADGDNNVSIDGNKGNNVSVSSQKLTVLDPKGGCFEDAFEPNDNQELAVSLSAGVHDGLGLCGNEDFYEVKVPGGSSLFVELSVEPLLALDPHPWELSLSLLGADGKIVDSSTKKGESDAVQAFVVPETGSYFVRVYPAAFGNAAHYALAVSIVPPVQGMDLLADDVIALPEVLYPGGVIDVSLALVNIGSKAVGSASVGLFLVSDPATPPEQGIALATLPVTGLGAASSVDVKTSVTLPDVPGGTYTVLAVADPDSVVSEANEDNNIGASGPIELDGKLSCKEDAFEPNNSAAIATTLVAQSGFYSGLSVCPKLDDWYVVDVPAEMAFSVTAKYNFQGSKGELGLQLFDSTTEGLVAQQINGKGAAAVVVPYVFNPGLYYVRVFNVNANGSPYDYSLGVTVGTPSPSDVCVPDLYEPNNAVATAKPIGCGLQELTLCKTDQDLFKLPAKANQPLTLTLSHSKGLLKGSLLVDPEGAPVATTSGNGQMTYAPTQGGNVYVLVEPKSKDTLSDFDYTLFVDGIAGTDLVVTSLDAFPTQLYQGEDTVVDLVIENQCISAAPALEWSVFVSTDPVWDPLDLEVLHGKDEQGLAGKDSANLIDKAIIPLSQPPGTAYLIAVADPADVVTESIETNNETGTPIDVMEVCFEDPLEPNDAPAQAPKLTVGQVYPALALCPSDLDWFAVDLQAGKQVTVSISFVDALGDLDLRLYGPSDVTKPVASSNNPGQDVETLTWVAKSTGKHFIRVNGFNGASNTYTLSVSVP